MALTETDLNNVCHAQLHVWVVNKYHLNKNYLPSILTVGCSRQKQYMGTKYSNMRRLTDGPVLSFLQVRYARLPAARERLFPRYFDGAQTFGSDIKSTTEKAAQLPDPCSCGHKPPVVQRTTPQTITNQTSCLPSISRDRRFLKLELSCRMVPKSVVYHV